MGSTASDIAGTRLGRYTLVRALGAGGMAELFLARAEGVGGFAKLVAIKRILPHKANNERFVRMLLNEAKLVASLDHPNIAHVHDIGVDQGQYFFVMEYVHGHDVRRVQHAARGHRLQLQNTLHVALGICAGLHHAHEARDSSGASLEIVHRDVSPANVIVSYDGAVKLVDFGVAKAASLVSETREGVIKGKFGYMSPEQCLGEPLDRRSDLFAVGIMLWELVTGRRLYKISGELVTLQRIVYADAPPPSRYIANMPPELERIIMRALARDRDQRYQTAQEIQLDLEAFAVESRLSVSPVSMAQEMRLLFRDRINAWQEAERAGRSLAEHLAELSSEDAIDSSEEVDSLDGVIAELHDKPFGREPTAATSVEGVPKISRASAPQIPTASLAPAAEVAPQRKGRSLWVVLLTALALIGGAAAWLLVGTQRKHTDVVARADGLLDAAPAETLPPDSGQEVVAVAVQPDASDAIEVEPDAAIETVPVVDEEPLHTPPKHGHRPRPHQGGTAAKVEPAAKLESPADAGVASVDSKGSGAQRPSPPIVPRPDAGPAAGTVDANEVRAVVKSHVGEIKDCVARAKMENRDLRGRVTLQISLSPAGKVTRTTVAASTGAPSTLETCFAKAVGSWTFPAPSGGVAATISYPFAF